MPLERFTDRVVVVTGAASGIGRATAARLAADRAYLDAVRHGEDPVDARLDQEWLSGIHQSNLALAAHTSG